MGVSKDEKKAFERYLKSAENEDSHGQFFVGTCYRKGLGVSKDEKKAFERYLKSANGGNQKGQIIAGFYYSEGEYVCKNERKAFELFLKSANSGDSDGQFLVGFYYNDGISMKVPVDGICGVIELKKQLYHKNYRQAILEMVAADLHVDDDVKVFGILTDI